MKKKILIIGNIGNPFEEAFDGGAIKTRLFIKILKREGYDVDLVNLFLWKKHPLSLLYRIKKNIKKCDRVIIMAGPNGCRVLLPLINKMAKKRKVVFCPLGIGTLDKKIAHLNAEEQQKFYFSGDYHFFADKRMQKELIKLDLIILQNNILCQTYENFYKIKNCVVLKNFRDVDVVKKTEIEHRSQNLFRTIYVSRINEKKGILDLVECVNELNNNNNSNIILDIYGSMQLNEKDFLYFNSLLDNSIHYCGELKNELVLNTISKYDLFVFPTKYSGEGTPGSLIESLLAGTPVLLSSFPFRNAIVRGPEAIIFEIGNKFDLKNKLAECTGKIDMLNKMRKEASITGEQFTYNYNRHDFLKYIGGENEDSDYNS